MLLRRSLPRLCAAASSKPQQQPVQPQPVEQQTQQQMQQQTQQQQDQKQGGQVDRDLFVDLHRTDANGNVLIHPLAKLQLGHTSMSRLQRYLGYVGRAFIIWALAHMYYTRSTHMDGGVASHSKLTVLSQDSKLIAWYFHLLGKTLGFTTSYMFQMKLPMGMEIESEELLTDLARNVMQSWPRQPERRLKGSREPLDKYTDEEMAACAFRAPEGFGDDFMTDDEVAEAPAGAGVWSAVAGALGFGKKTAAAEKKPLEEMFPGDAIGGYFVQRRCGQDNQHVRMQIGGSSAEQIGGRSMVLAPDPWEERLWVVSATAARGYATVRLSYATTPSSEWFPSAGVFGFLHRQWVITQQRYILTAAGRKLEADYAKKYKAAAGKRRHVLEEVKSV
eukprot:Rhum_TRINITY_DN10656_c0_g1::Rhum_TRINITY_DN10656_c0_g1_i1::g.39488::m.39488